MRKLRPRETKKYNQGHRINGKAYQKPGSLTNSESGFLFSSSWQLKPQDPWMALETSCSPICLLVWNMSLCDLPSSPPPPPWVTLAWLVVLLRVVEVWIISELLDVAEFHVLELRSPNIKQLWTERVVVSLSLCGNAGAHNSYSQLPHTKTRGIVLIIFQRLGEGWGHEKVAWFTVWTCLPPPIDKVSGWFIDCHLPLRPVCWCSETFIQSQETQGTWFRLWVIYYPYMWWNGQF